MTYNYIAKIKKKITYQNNKVQNTINTFYLTKKSKKKYYKFSTNFLQICKNNKKNYVLLNKNLIYKWLSIKHFNFNKINKII